jgi:hypothetical protein
VGAVWAQRGLAGLTTLLAHRQLQAAVWLRGRRDQGWSCVRRRRGTGPLARFGPLHSSSQHSTSSRRKAGVLCSSSCWPGTAHATALPVYSGSADTIWFCFACRLLPVLLLLSSVLQEVRSADTVGPVLVHVITEKGRGYLPAETAQVGWADASAECGWCWEDWAHAAAGCG